MEAERPDWGGGGGCAGAYRREAGVLPGLEDDCEVAIKACTAGRAPQQLERPVPGLLAGRVPGLSPPCLFDPDSTEGCRGSFFKEH